MEGEDDWDYIYIFNWDYIYIFMNRWMFIIQQKIPSLFLYFCRKNRSSKGYTVYVTRVV